MKKYIAAGLAFLVSVASPQGQTLRLSTSPTDAQAGAPAPRSAQYARLQQHLQKGWNTWDTNTIAGTVLLPEGLEVRLSLKHNTMESSGRFLSTILIGRQGATDEQVKPGPHAYDGSYSEFDLTWSGQQLRVESAHVENDVVMLVTPEGPPTGTSVTETVVFSVGVLWDRPGQVVKRNDRIVATLPTRSIVVYLAGSDSHDPYLPVEAPHFSADLSVPVGITTGRRRSLEEIRAAIQVQHRAYLRSIGSAGEEAPVLDAIQTTLGWDTIYEPDRGRVITPVSRIWNLNWGGYVLFDWDTFFAADMAAVGSRELAYANVLEVLNEATAEGFVANYARAGNWKSSDRSEPPVGSITVLALYRRFQDRWLLDNCFDRLLQWNRWWPAHRDMEGYLVWGSDGQNQPADLDDTSRGTLQGARYESGLDNGPAYDTAYFNPSTHQMEFADVGLMSLYIADSQALATIADILGKHAEAIELRVRAVRYSKSLARLWDAKTGIFLNKDLHTGMFSYTLSPTNFYPLVARVATMEQADEMLRRHLLDPDEFWGERVIPSIARNDPAFGEQSYWRGRIWAPMNFLVYQGLLNYNTLLAVQTRRQLADRSMQLFLHEWKDKGHVHENYSAVSDDSDTVPNSDRFYHWGAMLGLIEYEERSSQRQLSAAPQ